MGRSSGGMTGTQSSTMPSGELRLPTKAETTLSRLMARCCFCPLEVAMTSRRRWASPSMSSRSRRSLIASAPIPAEKYSPKRSRSSR